MRQIALKEISPPLVTEEVKQVALTDATIRKRKDAVLQKMREKGYDSLVIYADKEHYQNFYYFTGFMPRFEEGLFILHRDGAAYLILGNENMKLEPFSRSAAEAVLYSGFSLPNQPDYGGISLEEAFRRAGIKEAVTIGLAGWKLFGDKQNCFDIPHFIVEALTTVVGDKGKLRSAMRLLIDPGEGVRIINTANEIAHFEYGSTLAGNGVLRAYAAMRPGILETEVAQLLESEGQPTSVITIAAGSDRFAGAQVFPRQKPIQEGDPVSFTVGYPGGLSSRKGTMAAYKQHAEQEAYVEEVLRPYFAVLAAWLESIRIGMPGGELYDLIEGQLAQEGITLELNPGHLTAEEEWQSTPIYKGSLDTIQAGMIFQVDILANNPRGSASCEDGVVIADASLRKELQSDYPEVWGRMQARRDYLINEVGIDLPEFILPMSNTLGYFKPYLLSGHAVVLKA